MSLASLVAALLRYRRREALGLLLVAATCSALAAAAATAAAAGRSAAAESVRSGAAGRGYLLQVVTAADALPALGETPGLGRLRDSPGTARTSTAQTALSVREVSPAGLPIWRLEQGRRPAAPGEAALSRAAAAALGARIGGVVQLEVDARPRPARVVGVVVDPGDVRSPAAVLASPGLPAVGTTTWLATRDPMGEPALAPALERRSLTYRSTSVLAADTVRALRGPVSALQVVPPALAAAMGLALLAVLTASRGTRARDVAGMRAAGLPAWRASGVVGAGPATVVLVGQLAGLVVGHLAVRALREPLGERFGQSWEGVPVPWAAAAACLAVDLILLVGGRVGPGRLPMLLGRLIRSRLVTVLPRVAPVLVSAGLLALIGVNLRVLPVLPVVTPAGLAVVLGTPALATRLVTRGLPPATRRTCTVLVSRAALVAAVVGVLVWGAGYWSARTTHSTRVAADLASPLQPAGSLLVTEIPSAVADDVVRAHRAAGGQRVQVLDLPGEARRQVRVLSPRTRACMLRLRSSDPNDLPATCYPARAASSLNVVGLARDGSVPRADPALLDEGRVAVVTFTTGDPSGRAQVGPLLGATAEPSLGGNLPGLVLDPRGPQARSLGLQRSDASLVALFDFGTLSPQAQARVRRTITRAAPGAQVAESAGPDQDVRLALARAAAVLGALAAGLLLATAGGALLEADRDVRRQLRDVGSAALLRTVAGRWTAVLAVGAGVSGALGWWCAWLRSIHGEGGWGPLWPLPALVCLAVALAAGRLYGRVPSGRHE